jgi:hypothetical protein
MTESAIASVAPLIVQDALGAVEDLCQRYEISALQDFLETLGVPLRTTEMELRIEEPAAPDVRVGKLKHFHHKVEDLVFTNLSRLASQSEDIVNASLLALEKESTRRLDGLTGTIENLIASAGQQAPRIREDLRKLEGLRRGLGASPSIPPAA